ncbi:MAG: hypothetical protein Q4D56_15155 [Bacteroides sp.]|nr:hypothetical protein [Bacteroides sp.]
MKADSDHMFGVPGADVLASGQVQSTFLSIFEGNQLNIYRNKKDGEVVMHPNKILRKAENVISMRVCGVKKVTLWKEYEELEDESNPYCNVVIDAREGAGQIAIENTSAFDDPGKVSALLQDCFNRVLSFYGLKVEISPKMSETEVWDVVRTNCAGGDTVKKLVFEFVDPDRVATVDTSKSMLQYMRAMAKMVCAVGAVKGKLELGAEKGGALTLDPKNRLMLNLIHMCCNNGYELSLHFRRYGVYKCGKVMRAVHQMNEAYLREFNNGETASVGDSAQAGYKLLTWLDDIRKMNETGMKA